GKTDRFFIKQFEEETNLKSYVIVDASRSMDYASKGNLKKFDYASYIAAALSYMMIEQRDAVGLILYDEEIRVSLPPRATRSYLKEILKELESARPANKTGTSASLNRIAEQLKRRGLIILLSDLFDNPESVMMALKHFRHKGNEVVVMQVLDPLERSFAFDGDAVFKDLETREEIITQPWHIQKAYRQSMQEFLDYYKRRCRENNIDYVLLDTGTPFDRALFEYLNKRKRMM
ncbi:MAG: VWA domain-containing protein, partial [Ignavibacteriae bacterium]